MNTLTAIVRQEVDGIRLTGRLPGLRDVQLIAADIRSLHSQIVDTLAELHQRAGTGVTREDFRVELVWYRPEQPQSAATNGDRATHYADFIASPTWRFVIRPQVLARAGSRCEDCGAEAALDVHHKTYRNFGGSEQLSDLVATCRTCHEKRDKIRRTLRSYPSQARQLSPEEIDQFLATRPSPVPPLIVAICPACRAPLDSFGRCVCSWRS
jgi:5-methylcytosine-specific restriction endonuclease McrA